MIEITKAERATIQELTKTNGWKVIEKVLNAHLEDINKIDNLGEIAKISVETEVAGRVWVIKQLKKFLVEIGIYAEEVKERKDTSE